MANHNETRSIWRPGITLDELRGRVPRILSENIGIEMKELGVDHLSATMPVMRVLHGEASVVLAETLGTLAANAVNRDSARHFVVQEINATHLQSVPEGSTVTAVARQLYVGESNQVWNIVICDERGHLTSVARLTLVPITARKVVQ